MGKNALVKEKFFDLSSFEQADIFEDEAFVWEVIPKISEYLKTECRKRGKDILVGKGTVIEEGALIKGPAIIGSNCFIGHAAFLRNNCIVGNNVHIGHGCEIKNSIVLPDTAIAHVNYVGDSIIGRNVNLGGGAKTANFRLDGRSIRVKVGDKILDTGLVKFGAIVGDGSKIGVNAVLNPGTILGKNTLVYPLTSVVGVHNEGEVIT